jgi:hypothetical protein
MVCGHSADQVCMHCQIGRAVPAYSKPWTPPLSIPSLLTSALPACTHCYCGEAARGVSLRLHRVCCKCNDQKLKEEGAP